MGVYSESSAGEDQTQESVIQHAIDNTVINILSVGFILPAAVCDFQMTTIDKGRIAIAHVVGSCIGSIVWGFLADLKGRRIALMFALFIQGNAELLISLVSNYYGVVFFKFLSGFAVIGEMSILFPYVGEFQPLKYQKRILSLLSFIMVTGIIAVPLLAWAIIPLQFVYQSHYFFFRSWNLFLVACAIPAEILGIRLIFCAETPKYLSESGQTEKLMRVLTDMYWENAGGSAEEYIVNLTNSKHPGIREFINDAAILNDFKNQGEAAFKAPYLKRLIILCICFFCIASSFYTLLTWYPELFHRFSSFEAQYPNQTASVCSVSSKTSTNLLLNNASISSNCHREIDTSVYMNALFQGIACLVPNFLVLVLVDKLGFKFLAVSLTGLSILTTFGLYFANSYLQNVILSCIYLAVMSSVSGVMYSFLVLLFPTNISGSWIIYNTQEMKLNDQLFDK
ncbi:synaptic vesicle glycoprotein 2B-like [Leptopilina heterotoma]|uniref:synaptic vesicle glycoprotein 2B-like n=1 Tax=Leptopilina heterotoma TaxID=63436 RepID=UPI001CA838FC|nr:synaptic vesicle glycoprotein 2B-like [Leptopilina heterotoma]